LVTGSFKQQVAAREQLHAREEEEKIREAASPPPDIIRSEG
jgi:hypothetical protein